MTLDRLDRRRTLLTQLDQARADLSTSASGRQFDRYRQMTYTLLESDDLRGALDVRREPDATRDMYGRTLFGQSCLAARRLVEAGSRMVTVFWDEYGLAGSGWDTHWNHYPADAAGTLPRTRHGLVWPDYGPGSAGHVG